MTRRPSMQFYTSDWLGGTSLMSCTARGAYITMLATSWELGPIPNTRTALFKAMGLGPDDPPFDQVWPEVQSKWTLTDRGWTNAKLEKVRAARDAYCESQAEKGRKGGRPPKAGGKPELSETKPEGSEKLKAGGKPDESSPTPTPTPIFRSPDPSPDPSPTQERTETRARSSRANGTPNRTAGDEIDAIIATASQIGYPLQRFVLEREFIRQIECHSGRDHALAYCREFVDWAVVNGIEELAQGSRQRKVDPANWWRDTWSLYKHAVNNGRAGSVGDWRDECDRVHGGTYGSACETQQYHIAKVADQRAPQQVTA